jgi:hypothetical protein
MGEAEAALHSIAAVMPATDVGEIRGMLTVEDRRDGGSALSADGLI